MTTEQKPNTIEQDIREVKAMLTQICKALGIGVATPAKIFDLKERARKIIEIKTQKEKT